MRVIVHQASILTYEGQTDCRFANLVQIDARARRNTMTLSDWMMYFLPNGHQLLRLLLTDMRLKYMGHEFSVILFLLSHELFQLSLCFFHLNSSPFLLQSSLVELTPIVRSHAFIILGCVRRDQSLSVLTSHTLDHLVVSVRVLK